MGLVTREQLRRRLEDGRWHQVSVGAARWFVDSPIHETQLKLFCHRDWTAATGMTIGNRPRTMYRIRLRPEYVNPLN